MGPESGLPVDSTDVSTTKSVSSKAKRKQIVVACEACRKSKTRCSGSRPACRTCEDRSLQCHYSADADAHPIAALKRKYTALSDAYKQQTRELQLLQSRQDPKLAKCAVKPYVPAIQDVPILTSTETGFESVQSPFPIGSVSSSIFTLPCSPSQGEAEISGDQAVQIFGALKYRSDQESLILLARLRLGEDIGSLVDSLFPVQLQFDAEAEQADVSKSTSAPPSSTLAHKQADALCLKNHFIAVDASPTDEPQSPKTIHSAKTLLRTPKPWLAGMFDRQYFKQVCYIQCAPGSSIVSAEPGSQSSFGNMPFSSAIAANHFPEYVQDTQQNNFTVPVWEQRVLNGGTTQADPFEDVLAQLMDNVAKGVAVDDLCGSHPYIEALDNPDTFHRAPLLSQIAARTIASIKTTDTSTTFTQYAMMYWFWALWRWLLYPTKETYAAIPEFAQPTTSQLFVSHPSVFDFVLPPGLRDMLCQHRTPNIQWFTEAAITIKCHWNGDAFAALCRDGMTNEIDFNPICKSHISSLGNWTLGSSVRMFLPNVDSFANVK